MGKMVMAGSGGCRFTRFFWRRRVERDGVRLVNTFLLLTYKRFWWAWGEWDWTRGGFFLGFSFGGLCLRFI